MCFSLWPITASDKKKVSLKHCLNKTETHNILHNDE